MKTKKLACQSGRTRPNSSILCVICAGGARKFSVFKLRLQYRWHYFMVCKVLIFLACQNVEEGQKDTLPPTSKCGVATPMIKTGHDTYPCSLRNLLIPHVWTRNLRFCSWFLRRSPCIFQLLGQSEMKRPTCTSMSKKESKKNSNEELVVLMAWQR